MLIKANGPLKIRIAADMFKTNSYKTNEKKTEQTKRKKKTWSQLKIIFY